MSTFIQAPGSSSMVCGAVIGGFAHSETRGKRKRRSTCLVVGRMGRTGKAGSVEYAMIKMMTLLLRTMRSAAPEYPRSSRPRALMAQN